MIVAALQGAVRSAADWWTEVAGRPVRRCSADRHYLEREILPALSSRIDMRRVLFVGCARYTRHYEVTFANAEYWTIDPDPRRRRWGARRHIVDRLERLGRHRPEAYFDLIVCNGVLGWGLNRREDAECAFEACYRALRVGGTLVLGWNDIAPRNAVRPVMVRALQRFVPCALHGAGGAVVRIDAPNRHVFEFYRKPSPPQADSVVGASGAAAQADSGRQAPAAHSS